MKAAYALKSLNIEKIIWGLFLMKMTKKSSGLAGLGITLAKAFEQKKAGGLSFPCLLFINTFNDRNDNAKID